MRTARSLPYGGGLCLGGLCTGESLLGSPPTENPCKEHGTRDRDPPEGIWDQAARQEVTSYRDHLPPVNRMTDRCKNITLSQTSFAGGKKVYFHFSMALKTQLT